MRSSDIYIYMNSAGFSGDFGAKKRTVYIIHHFLYLKRKRVSMPSTSKNLTSSFPFDLRVWVGGTVCAGAYVRACVCVCMPACVCVCVCASFA